MHEISIARSILGIITGEMKRRSFKRLKSVSVRVGELTAVDPEALRFTFDACTKGTWLKGAELLIEEVPLMGRCRGCGREFRAEGFRSVCAFCGGDSTERISGDELEVVSMEAS